MTVKLGLWVAIIFFVICGSVLIYKTYTLEPKIIRVANQPSLITGETTKVETFKDKQGVTHTTFKIDERNIITAKDLKNKDRQPTYLDTIALVLNIAINRIKSLERYELMYKADSLQGVRLPNTKRIGYSDKYAQIGYTPNIDTAKVGYFDLAYNNTLAITNYDKRERVLGLGIGQKINYTDIATEDSRATINGYKSITVKKPVPFFGLRGQVLSRYNFANNTIGAGLGLRLDLGRVSVLGAYIYTPSNNVITPQLGFNYDVFRF